MQLKLRQNPWEILGESVVVVRVGVFIVQLLFWPQSRLLKHLSNLFLSLIPELKRCDLFIHPGCEYCYIYRGARSLWVLGPHFVLLKPATITCFSVSSCFPFKILVVVRWSLKLSLLGDEFSCVFLKPVCWWGGIPSCLVWTKGRAQVLPSWVLQGELKMSVLWQRMLVHTAGMCVWTRSNRKSHPAV